MQNQLYGMRERLAFTAGALVMLGILLASFWTAVHTVRDLNEAERAQIIRAETVDLLDAVTTAETGQRGYLLTGKEAYLGPYTLASRRVPMLLENASRDIGPSADFTLLRQAITDKMAELAQTVQLAGQGKRDQAMRIVDSDRGQEDMDRARAVASKLTDAQRLVLRGDALAVVTVLALSLFVTGSARRTVRDLRAVEAALQAANAALAAGRDRLELAVRERTVELTSANQEIQRFAYIVSHDLRAPLLNIIGFTSELEHATATLAGFVQTHIAASGGTVPSEVRSATEEDLPEAIRFIQASTAKMDRLINAILRLSREGRRVLVPEALDMGALCAGVVDSLRHQAAETVVTIGDLPPLVSDRIAIEQIISNLLDNALKYSQPGRPGRIDVTGRREGEWVSVSVADNGRGIAPRDMERVFDLFRRAGPQDRPGEGIGLAHVRALVRRLGGTIDCTSTPDVGSTFVLRLPLVLSHAAEPR